MVSTSGLSIDVDGSQLLDIIHDLDGYGDPAKQAIVSTLRVMAAWAKTRSIRGLSGKLKIQQKALRKRTKSFSAGAFKIWFGLNDIPVTFLHPRQSGDGVAADGDRFYDKAFMIDTPGRGPHPVRRTAGTSGHGKGDLKDLMEPIAPQAMEYIEDEFIGTPEFVAQFYKVFERELKWRMRKLALT